MKNLFLCCYIALGVHLVHSQSAPIVVVNNIAVAHEQKGWKVINVLPVPIHFNLMKGDLVLRIDGKNAAETGPMLMASLLNQGNRQKINLFIKRGDFPMEIAMREISAMDYDFIGATPFRHVASGFSAPDGEFKDIDGQQVNLEQFKGKWLLINFMGTYCAPCMEPLANVLSVAEHNDLSLDLLIVALNDKAETVRRIQKNFQITTPLATMPAMAQLPMDFGITTSHYSGQIPAFVLIRPDGEVALIDIGGINPNRIEKTIECLMHCKADEILSSTQLSMER